MRNLWLGLVLLLLSPAISIAQIDLAIVADVEKFATLPPTLTAANALIPSAFVVLGDYDHRNPQTLKAFTTMAEAMTAAFSQAGVTVPIYETWDDHNYCRNNASSACPTRELAIATWGALKFMCPDNGWPLGIWQRCELQNNGVTVSLYLLDVRSSRRATNNGDRTMLGADQDAWLADRLATDQSTWKIIAGGVPFNPTVFNDRDSWQGFPASWSALLTQLAPHRGVIFASGDLHGGAIDDGTFSHYPELNVPRSTQGTFVPGCASCGLWTIPTPRPTIPGFGWIRLTETEATLTIHTADGTPRASLTIPR